MATNVAEFT